MRLTELASALVASAITDQADPGETIHHEVLVQLAGRPGGFDPELVIIVIGYVAGVAVMAPPATIHAATTTQAAVDVHVATALTWIRSQ
ncbi:hypothetical protein [Streptosporangium sp. NPDC020145]|uniref:hypothetical protein n=1 Tax=Streptosporangium sp. NPDC020145 TaxID=3154694 RepID=UPI00342EF278